MKKYRTKSGTVEEKLPGVNATVNPSEKTQIAMAGGANTLKDVQTILGQEGKRNNLKGQGAKHLVSFFESGGGMGGQDDPDEPSDDPGPAGGMGGQDDPDEPPGPGTFGGREVGPSFGVSFEDLATEFHGKDVLGRPKDDWATKDFRAMTDPGSRQGMGVYGLRAGELSWLGTEGYGDPESLGDISQWGPSDYARAGKPSSLEAEAPEEDVAVIDPSVQVGPLTGPQMAFIDKEMRQETVLDDLVRGATNLITNPTKADVTRGIISAVGGPLGAAWGALAGRGINEPPGPRATQPLSSTIMSVGRLGPPEDYGFKTAKDYDEPGDFAGYANMAAPPDYSTPKGGDTGDSSKAASRVARAAANNTTLAIAEEDDFTRDQIRKAQRQITRFA